MKRQAIADLILQRLQLQKSAIKAFYEGSSNEIGYFYIDHLLSAELVKDIYQALLALHM